MAVIKPSDLLKSIIDEKVIETRKRDVWQQKNARFAPIKDLSVDTRGVVGERFVEQLLKNMGHFVERNEITDRTNKHWDLRVNRNITLEVKTATIGKEGRTFQHENIERDRNYDALVLLDIAPDAIYLTVAKKDLLPFNRPNDNFTATLKNMHRRAHGILYKWDLSLRDVQDRCIVNMEEAVKLFTPILK